MSEQVNEQVMKDITEEDTTPKEIETLKVQFQGKTEIPFASTLLITLVRISAFLVVGVLGAYLVFDELFWYVNELRLVLLAWALPNWFIGLSVWTVRGIIVLSWAVFSLDTLRAFDIVGQWQRRNVYFLGLYIACLKPGPRARLPLLMSWGEPIDMRLRIVRWTSNLVFTIDRLQPNPEMTIHYRVNPETPERTEIELQEGFDKYVLTNAESVTRAVAGKYTLGELQGEVADEEFVRMCQNEVGDLGIVKKLSVTDVNLPPATAAVLAQRAERVSQAEGRREGRKIDMETFEYGIKIGEALRTAGLEISPAELAVSLFEQDRMVEMGDDSRGTYIFGADRLLNKLQGGDREEIADLLRQIISKKNG